MSLSKQREEKGSRAHPLFSCRSLPSWEDNFDCLLDGMLLIVPHILRIAPGKVTGRYGVDPCDYGVHGFELVCVE
jgi:hypothetical protein